MLRSQSEVSTGMGLGRIGNVLKLVVTLLKICENAKNIELYTLKG